jgi:tRNA A-37 threonylcarbamoyl transferase component Bud32
MMETFGRYQLKRRIGTGGMAEVFVASAFGAEGFVKEVVIKRILPAFGEDPEFVRMFINEARLAARLQHANIVQIYDFNHVDGVYYIAMEWVDGLDLRSVANVARRRAIPLPLHLAVHVGVETLKGLHYAHTRSEGGRPLDVVHRDISPHNLLVSFAGEVKITDFGIAKAAAVSAATRRGSVKGKLAYMSPEQVQGESVDARSDLFSLGVVLWELLAGHRLYQADSEGELFAKVRQAEVPPLREQNPEVTPELEAVIRRLLAARVEDRFQAAADALGVLGGLARIDDAIQVASYLRALLPGQAGRDRRGATEALGSPPAASVAVAPADAATRTQGEAGEAGEIVAAPPQPGAPLWSDPVVIAPEPPSPVPSRRRQIPTRALLAALVAGGCAALGWWGGGLLSARGGAPPEVAQLSVKAPAGSTIVVEGVPLGPPPVALEGVRGTRLRLEARRREATASTLAILGAASSLLLASPDAGAVPSPRHRDGGRASARADALPPADVATVARVSPDLGRRERPRRPAAKVTGQGRLNVVVIPWARVKIDGKEVGQTPILGHLLGAGTHSVELHNSELGKRERRQVVIVPGKLEKIRVRWD